LGAQLFYQAILIDVGPVRDHQISTNSRQGVQGRACVDSRVEGPATIGLVDVYGHPLDEVMVDSVRLKQLADILFISIKF